MVDSDKGFSSSNTLRSPLVSKSSTSGLGENDENEVSQDQMISKLLIPNKPVAKRPRRKILAERNENLSFSEGQNQRTPDLEMKNITKKSNNVHSDMSSTNACVSNSDEGVVGDSSLKPYDPFTNYLVPRPKYLRYDPNKRRKIFQVSKSREGLSDEGEEEDVEEENEEFEEKGWCITGVLRFLLIMFIYFLSTSSPIRQAISGFKDDYPIVHKQICDAVYIEVYGGGFLVREDGDSGLEVHDIQVVENNYLVMVDTSGAAEMVEEDDNVQLVEVDNVERVEGSEPDLVEDDNVLNMDSITEFVEYDCDSEAAEMVEEDDNVQLVEAAEMVEEDDNVQLVEVDNVERVEGSEPDLVEDNNVLNMDSITEFVEYDYDSEVSEEMPLGVAVIAANKDNRGGGVDHIEGEKLAQGNHSIGYDLLNKLENLEKPTISEEDQTPLNTGESSRPDMEILESLVLSNYLIDEISKELGETEKVGPNILVALGAYTMSVVLSSLAFICCSKKFKTTSVKDSQPSIEPFTPKVEDESEQVGPTVDEGHIVKEIESSARPPLSLSSSKAELIAKGIETSTRPPSSLSRSMVEATEETGSHIHAPTVELLGEIVIGEVAGSSKRKIPAIDFEESYGNATQKGSKARPVSVTSQPSKPEISTKDWSLYRSNTEERKISKKERGKDGELNVEFTTPMRRSSRLRNRSVVSP